MSKMLVITYDDGERSAVASWSEEYGWFMAGDKEILERLTIEERESRPKQTVIPPMSPAAVGGAVLTNAAEPTTEMLGGGACFSCGCPEVAHAEGGCAAHGCRTYVP